jgi:hypothetical protein
VLELRNTSDRELVLDFGTSVPQLDLKGPGVARYSVHAMSCIPAPPLPLKPGEAHKIPIRQFSHFSGKATTYTYWTRPGEYALTATIAVDARERDAPKTTAQRRQLVAGPIKITVT